MAHVDLYILKCLKEKKSWLGLQINVFGAMYIMLFKTVIPSTIKELKIKPFKV